jgi:transposase
MKECPMCGENMHLSIRDIEETTAGQREPSKRQVREWVCPECEYFEEAEPGDG